MSTAIRSALLTLGLALVGLGGVLIGRPFSTLDTLVVLVLAALVAMTVGELLGSPRPWSWPVRLAAVCWLTAAIVIGTQPGISTMQLAVVVGIAVLAQSVAAIFGGLRGTALQQFLALLFGMLGVVLGLCILAWPSITVLLAAVLFGVRVVWFGATLFWTGVRGTFDPAEPFQPGSPRRVPVWVASAVALTTALVLGSVSYTLHEGGPDKLEALPIPADLPSEPGRLVTAEKIDAQVGGGTDVWRILYTTTRDTGEPAVSSGLVFADDDLPDGPRPVLAWAHGTTGVVESCAPSSNPSTATFAAVPGVADVLSRGWVVVATDYIGLGTPGPHPYLIGQGEGRSVLDSVRAAHELDEYDLSEETVVWGHSQGGGAALWTGILAEEYAPGIDLVGVAGVAPASDLVGLVANIASSPVGVVFAAYVLEAYSQAYPEVDFDSYLQPGAREPMRAFTETCSTDRKEQSEIAKEYADSFKDGIYTTTPPAGPVRKRLEQNTPNAAIPAPTLILQGDQDLLVLPTVQAAYVAGRCGKPGSGPLDYRTYAGRGHVDIIAQGSAMIPDLLAWTQDRFDGKPAAASC